MENKFLCVMAGYDNNTEQYLSDLQKNLYNNGYIGEQTKDLPQHITLGTFDINEENNLKETINNIAENTKPFEITFSHIGIFGGSKILFIAPDINRELLILKENFGPNYNWVPHTTMLIDKPEIIYQALPLVANFFNAFNGRINTLYLYEFWPTRLLYKEKLNIAD